MIRRVKVDFGDEHLIIGYMIMSDAVISVAYKNYKAKVLHTRHFTEYFRPIFRWAIKYYSVHEKAPKKTIQKIFRRKKNILSPEERKIVSAYIRSVVSKTSDFEDDPDYVSKTVMEDFIKRQETEYIIEEAKNCLEQKDYSGADELIKEYSGIGISNIDVSEEVKTPLDMINVEERFTEQYIEKRIIFEFPGDLGILLGPLQRGWLVAVTGVEKGGKSFFMWDIALQAIMQKKRVLIVDVDNPIRDSENRLDRRISGLANEDDAGRLPFPIFDCQNNQSQGCQVRDIKRLNKAPLIRNKEEIANYWGRRNWKVCTKCRGKGRKNARLSKKFIPAIWFDPVRVKPLTRVRLMNALKRQRTRPLDNLRTLNYPRYSKTFDEVRDTIYRYIDRSAWVPHIIIFDYLDILLGPPGKAEERHVVDEKWKKAAGMAGEIDGVVITADQATKIYREKYLLDQMATSESKTKDAHLDLRIGLNKTDSERELGVSRASVIFHRHRKYSVKNQVMLMQCLEIARPILDNSFWLGYSDKYNVSAKK